MVAQTLFSHKCWVWKDRRDCHWLGTSSSRTAQVARSKASWALASGRRAL